MKTGHWIVIAALCFGPTSVAFGFGPNGHRITALVAAELLKDNAQATQKLKDILGNEPLSSSLPRAATYPDDHKTELTDGTIEQIYKNPDIEKIARLYKGSRDWHFDKRQVCDKQLPTIESIEKWCPKNTRSACFSAQYPRQVHNDHTVHFARRLLQLPRSPIRAHFVRCRVLVHVFPDTTLGISFEGQLIATYSRDGELRPPAAAGERAA